MNAKKPKRRLTKAEREAFAKVGSAGGKTTAKRLGKKGMSALGTKGAIARWGPKKGE